MNTKPSNTHSSLNINKLPPLNNQKTKALLTHPQLIIFDCDGTLVDSELISYEIYAEVFAQEGYVKTPKALLHEFSGFSLATMIERVSAHVGHPISSSTGERIQEKIVNVFREKLREVPGIHQLLDQLNQKDIPFCLVSNGLPERISAALEATNLAAYFTPKTIFDVDAAQKGKPAPDLFLFAAHTLQVAPHHCLVIEDSATGIQAAHAAEMPVIALLAGAHAHAAEMPVIALLAGAHAHAPWYQDGIKKTKPTLIAYKTETITQLFA